MVARWFESASVKKDILHIGITGTRSGLNELQYSELIKFLMAAFEPGAIFHHGDCIGVDVEAAWVAREIGYKIVGHPPIKKILRGYFDDDETRPEKNYLARNRDIVDESFVLLVIPKEMEPVIRSGTWSTQRYAEKNSKPFVVIWPEAK